MVLGMGFSCFFSLKRGLRGGCQTSGGGGRDDNEAGGGGPGDKTMVAGLLLVVASAFCFETKTHELYHSIKTNEFIYKKVSQTRYPQSPPEWLTTSCDAAEH